MKISELLKTDSFYRDHQYDWQFYQAAYDGYRSLIDIGLLDDFKNPEQYLKPGRAYGFNYSKQVNCLTCGFVAQSDFTQDFGKLADDESFNLFLNDADLFGTDFSLWWGEVRNIVGCFGFAGILTTQANGGNPSAMRAAGVYPYIAAYSPLNILERRFDRDPVTARPRLSYLKLKSDNPNTITVWSTDSYETYRIPDKNADEDEELIAIPELSGPNELGEIPFTFFIGIRDPGKRFEGVSLIKDIAPIDASMIRSAIRVDSIEQKSAFPILAIAQEEDRTREGERRQERTININGSSPIVEYDPENSNARPYWIAPEADRAIPPILQIWEKKESEIFKMSFLQGFQVSSTSAAAHSGEAFEQMFKFLEARLSELVDNECEARRNVIRHWLKWQNKPELFKDINISHAKEFNVEPMTSVISDVLTEKTILSSSKIAQKELKKQVVMTGTLREISEETKNKIFKEIDRGEQIISDKSISDMINQNDQEVEE